MPVTDRGGSKPGRGGVPGASRREELDAGRPQAQRPLRLKSLLTALEPHIGWMSEEQRHDLTVAIDGGDLARAQDHLTQLQDRYPKNLTIKKTLGLFRAEAVARLEEVLGGLHTVPRKTSLFPQVRTPERSRISAAIDGLTPVEGILRKSKVDRLRGLEAIASWFRAGAIEIIDASFTEAVHTSRSMRVEPTAKSALESQPPPPLWDDSETTQRYDSATTPLGAKGKYALTLEDDATVKASRSVSRPTPPEPRLAHTSPPPPATLPFSSPESARAPAQRTGLRALARAARSFDRPTKTLRGLEAPKLSSDIEGALPEAEHDRTTSHFGDAEPPEQLPEAEEPAASLPVVSAVAPETVSSAGVVPAPETPEGGAEEELPIVEPAPAKGAAPTLLSEGEEARAPAAEPEPEEAAAVDEPAPEEPAATSVSAAKVASAPPPAAAQPVAAPAPAKRAMWPFALGAAAIAAVAVYAVVDFGGEEPRPSPTDTTVASAPVATTAAPSALATPTASSSAAPAASATSSATASPSGSAQAATVKVTLEIEPHFAKVLLDGKALPKKTKELTLPRDGKEHEIRVESAGFRKRKIKVKADRDAHLVITLEVIPKAQKPKPLYE